MRVTPPVSDYSVCRLSVLEGLEAVRKRPGMYIGSTDHRGLMHCFQEIIDSTVDEALEGYCGTTNVRLHPDYSVSVANNGRGIPADEVLGVGLSGMEVVYTKLHAGDKFGGGSYASPGGLHGVGASVVNALSARLDAQVDRDSKTQEVRFRRGESGEFDDSEQRIPNSPSTPFTDSSRLKTVGKAKKDTIGTRVCFWADLQTFLTTEGLSWKSPLVRARQTAFLVPGLTINCWDKRAEEALHESFRFDGGVVDSINWLAGDGVVMDTWHIEGSGTFTETVQVLDPATGHLATTEVECLCEVDRALRWGIGCDTTLQSSINIIATPKGDIHIAGFEQTILKVLRAQIDENSRKLRMTAKDGCPEKGDVQAGLTTVVTVRFPEPQLEGQTKEVLSIPQVRVVANRAVSKWLKKRFSSSKYDDEYQTPQLLEKVVGEMETRVSARTHKETSRRKNALETSSLPAKFADCHMEGVSQTEFFIVKGDSALDTAKTARNSQHQALSPIRGKILNAQKASTVDMLMNARCANIIQATGAGLGGTFDIEQTRYGKAILTTDADVDGAHIRTPLLTLFSRYTRLMVGAGRIYAAVPPLHRIDVSARGRKPRELVYIYSEAELHVKPAQLKKQGRTWKEPTQRYKGLGEMDADQLAEATMDCAHRSLRWITLANEAALHEAEEVFELLMGSIVGPRKEFIVEGSSGFGCDRIDA